MLNTRHGGVVCFQIARSTAISSSSTNPKNTSAEMVLVEWAMLRDTESKEGQRRVSRCMGGIRLVETSEGNWTFKILLFFSSRVDATAKSRIGSE